MAEDILSQLENLPLAQLAGSLGAEIERRKKQPQSPAALAEIISGGKWKRAKHLNLLDTKLVDLAMGKIKRLLVMMPPRSGKSELCSKFFPAWYLGTFPDRRYVLTSYADSFAATWGGKARDILMEHGHKLFGVKIREDSKAQDRWRLERRDGEMFTTGVGSSLTGRGAHLLSCDDPVKNAEQAASKTYRDKAWDWWRSVALTRLEPDGACLVILTRWHEDDLAGRLLKQDDEEYEDDDGTKWEILCLPAVAELDDPIGRQPGEALWPSRWPIHKLRDRERTLGKYFFAALYQQRPAPDSGEVFKREWFRYYRKEGDVYRMLKPGSDEAAYSVPISKCTRIAVMDVASSDEQTADYTVLMVVDITPSYDAIVVDVWRSRSQSPEVISTAAAMCRRHNVQSLGVEKNGVGLGVYQILKRKSVTVKPLHAKGDKRTRTRVAAQARMQAGMIYFDPSASYTADLERELLDFPKGAHDDLVDAVAWMSIWVQDLGGPPREPSDDAYDKQLDAQDAQPSNRLGDLVTAEVAAGAPQEGLSDEARAWLRGEMLGWMRPSRN